MSNVAFTPEVAELEEDRLDPVLTAPPVDMAQPAMSMQPTSPLMTEPMAAEPTSPLMTEPFAPEPAAPLMTEPFAPEPATPLMTEPFAPEAAAPLMTEPFASEAAAPLMNEPFAPEPAAPLMNEPFTPEVAPQPMSEPFTPEVAPQPMSEPIAAVAPAMAEPLSPEPAAPLAADPMAAAPAAAMAVAAGEPDVDGNPDLARPIPRISIQAFCEDQRTAECLQAASGDRRLAKAHVSVHLGGTAAALANFQDAPTPNLIIIESLQSRDGMLAELDQLASVCDAGTKVVVIGHVNDVILYRELLRRGVSEYVVAPVSELKIMESISNLYNDPDADPVGHVYAFVGAKGGVGSSTICHNVAWALSRELRNDVVIADLDLPFGTAGLDFDKDPVQGIADALSSPDRLDEVLLDRLLSKCTDHLSLFASPSTLDRDYDIAPEAFEWVVDVVRQNVPYVAVDMPHIWTPWTRQLLTQADEIVITVAPDLANLRNAKNLVDLLRDRRSNDNPPHLVINQTGMPKRPEIPAAKFAEALGLTPACIIEFDGESFGMASNNGQMIGEFAEHARAAEQLRNLAFRLIKRPEQISEPVSKLTPFLEKFKIKK